MVVVRLPQDQNIEQVKGRGPGWSSGNASMREAGRRLESAKELQKEWPEKQQY